MPKGKVQLLYKIRDLFMNKAISGALFYCHGKVYFKGEFGPIFHFTKKTLFSISFNTTDFTWRYLLLLRICNDDTKG